MQPISVAQVVVVPTAPSANAHFNRQPVPADRMSNDSICMVAAVLVMHYPYNQLRKMSIFFNWETPNWRMRLNPPEEGQRFSWDKAPWIAAVPVF